MKAEELMIGNWVYDKIGRPCQLVELRPDHYITILSNGQKLKYHYHTSNPIPLTRDWLKDFGFRFLNSDDGLSYYGLENDQGDIFFEVYYTGDCYKHLLTDVEISYVHQLQNLYYALTGEQLTRNL